MLERGIMLLTRFCQDNRIQIHQPRRNLQIKVTRPIGKNEFVAYVDGIGKLDVVRSLLEWKTSSSCYLEEPEGRVPVLKETDHHLRVPAAWPR